MDVFGSFGTTARGLSRNPLGIVALFIVLVYGIAALTLGVSADGLDPHHKTPLVWFLVLFPPVVLGVFAWLVSQHHTKLYAPGDFRDDRAFLEALSPAEQLQRLEKEVDIALDIESSLPEEAVQTQPEFRQTIDRRLQLREMIAQAEDLALREVDAEFGGILQRRVKIEKGDVKLYLDGAIEHKGELLGIEVTFLSSSRHQHTRLQQLADTLLRAKIVGVRMVIVIVIGEDAQVDVERLRAEAQQRLEGGDFAAELRLYRFKELQKKYDR